MPEIKTPDFLQSKEAERPQPPAPSRIKRERDRAGMTPGQAGGLVHVSPEVWSKWETGNARMHPAFWELFQLKLERIRSGNG